LPQTFIASKRFLRLNPLVDLKRRTQLELGRYLSRPIDRW
jgi:hypothetical protein